MKVILRNRSLVVVVVMGAIIMALTLFQLYRYTFSLLNSSASVNHTYEVMSRTAEIDTEVRLIHALQRAYLVNKDTVPMQNLARQIQQVEQQLEGLRTLVSDNRQQVARLDSLKLVFDSGMRTFKSSNMGVGGLADPVTQALLGKNKHDEDTFISRLAAFMAVEKHLLGDRRARENDSTIKFEWFLGIPVIFLVILSVTIVYSLWSNGNLRKELIGQNVDLQKSLKELSMYKYALDESAIVAVTDRHGRITHVNENFCAISQYTSAELIGQDHRIVNSSFHPKEFIRSIWQTIQAGKVWKGELRNKAKDGTIYWVDTSIVPFLDDQGKPYQYVAIRSDITERKKTEQMRIENLELERRLNESQRIYKTIASNIPGVVICLMDHEYRFILVEGHLLGRFGYQKSQLLGNRAVDILPPDRYAFYEPLYERAFTGQTFSVPLQRDGSDYLLRLVPLRDTFGNVDVIMTVSIDVTELKAAAREIKALNADLERKIHERTEQLHNVNKELESFSYSVAHDLRTPLRAVSGYASILNEDYHNKIDDEGKRLLGELKYNTRKMGDLIDDLLTFSKLGRKALRRAPVDMGGVIQSVLAELDAGSLVVEVNDILPATADPALIRHVVVNLISNAIKYSSRASAPRLIIASERRNEMIEYSFRDNGVGFDMKYVHKLFGVFQRLHSSEDFDGTGVGLAIAQKIVQKHGGTIRAEGKINEGACFTFSLPAVDTFQYDETNPEI